jgi:primosomal protein N' (replication factor Y)
MHKARGGLRCHYCDFSMPVPTDCPSCNGVNLTTPGMGTEKVEEEILKTFPGVRTIRMDRDTTRKKGSARRIVESVERREVDILIGTQMVSKGHDFAGVTLVGVISGDTALGIPDFRSAERTFQLITQAAGRAGRGEAPGRVVIQTLNPTHYCFTSAITHDYDGFYEIETAFRAETGYPPFSRLCCIRLDGTGERTVAQAATRLSDIAFGLSEKLTETGRSVTVLGPVPAMLARLKGRYRWNLLVKCTEVGTLHSWAFQDRQSPFLRYYKNFQGDYKAICRR